MPGLRTLIVDDDRDFAESIADLMEMLGHKPQLAYDGKRALERFREQHFDVVLMDVRMPEMNGIEAFKAVKVVNPDAKVVLMTGYSMDQELSEALDAGALGVMHKPVDMRELEVLLGEITPEGSIVVVEHDHEFAALLSERLEDSDCRVAVAQTDAECFSLIQSHEADLIVLDLDPPGMGVAELLDRLKRSGGVGAPVIIVTPHGAEIRAALGDAAAAIVLDLPSDADEVLRLVDPSAPGSSNSH